MSSSSLVVLQGPRNGWELLRHPRSQTEQLLDSWPSHCETVIVVLCGHVACKVFNKIILNCAAHLVGLRQELSSLYNKQNFQEFQTWVCSYSFLLFSTTYLSAHLSTQSKESPGALSANRKSSFSWAESLHLNLKILTSLLLVFLMIKGYIWD